MADPLITPPLHARPDPRGLRYVCQSSRQRSQGRHAGRRLKRRPALRDSPRSGSAAPAVGCRCGAGRRPGERRAAAGSWSSWCRRSRPRTTRTARRPSRSCTPRRPTTTRCSGSIPSTGRGTRIVGDLAESWTVVEGRAHVHVHPAPRRPLPRRQRADGAGRQGELRQDHLPAPRDRVQSQGRVPRGGGGRGARPAHRRLPPQVAVAVVPLVARLALQLDLQGRHPGPRHPLVRAERHGYRPLPLRGIREGLTLDRPQESRLLGSGQALSRRLPRDLRPGFGRPGRGHPRPARDDPVSRLLTAGAGHPGGGARARRSPCRRAPGSASTRSPSITSGSPSTTGECGVRSPSRSIASRARRRSRRSRS